jgi:hypothetical protein
MAPSHESTSKPGTRAAQILITMPLTTKIKSPSVRMVIGRVRNKRIGFTKILTNPTTKAATSAAKNPETLNPGTT